MKRCSIEGYSFTILSYHLSLSPDAKQIKSISMVQTFLPSNI